jgi:hypothetical protein
MQYHPSSPRWLTCIFCKGTVTPGAAVWRAGHPYHATCLVRLLTSGSGSHVCRTLRRGLLPAGKARNARRTDLYNEQSATAEVGRHA